MSEYAKPLPRVTALNQPFWEATRRHELRLQRCVNCARFRYPPSPVCPECLSEESEWARVSGRGTVTTWVVFHRKYFESFAADLPYHVVQVQLDEGPRLTANVVDVPNDEMHIGMPVEAVFDDVTPEITLVRFRRRR